MHCVISRLLISWALSSLLCASAFAGTVTVPFAPTAKRPAGDLVHQGRPIDESEATELARKGVEIWRLDPQESLLWKDQSLPASDEARHGFPQDGATVRFDSYLASTQGIFRSSIDAMDAGTGRLQAFTLTVSLSNPAAVMRAALLRRIGYQVSNPKAYRSLKLAFESVEARDKFLDNLADRSLTSRDRWVKDKPKDRAEVTLQGVVLEPGRINVQTVHWGLMSAALQRDRRVFRALLVPDVLLDFTEKVNPFAWETGRVFNGAAIFDYLFSDGFSDVSLDDIRWITSRIAGLSREELADAVARAGLPSDIAAILVEKIASRRNGLVKLLGLAGEHRALPVNMRLDAGQVIQGQLRSGEYPGYPQEFHNEADLPPLRFSQLWRYAAIEGISAGISQLLGQVNTRLLTYADSGSAVKDHAQEVRDGVAKYLFKTGSLSGLDQPAGVWAKPLAGATINASRAVVAGTYLGSDSQVQLVDTLSVDLKGGFYLGWDGAAPLAPGVASTASLSRTYVHVKPVMDMNSALKADWRRLLVVKFMHGLSKSLDPDIECMIPEGPWKSDFEFGGKKFVKVNYDANRPKGKEEALELRARLVAEGTPADTIILQANDRDSDCKSEVEKAVDKNLETFTEGLAVGDSFIVTDAIRLDSTATISIPIGVLLGNSASVNPNGSVGYEVARQTMIRRTADGYQFYLQDRRLESESAGADFRYLFDWFGFKKGRIDGKGTTQFFNIVTEGADTGTKRKLIRSIKALLRANSSEVLTDSFEPYTLKHDLFSRVLKFKFLLWRMDAAKQYHEVDVYPPLEKDGNGRARDPEAYKRTLAMRRSVRRSGMDWFGFLLDAAGKLTGGLVSLPGLGAGGDPGNSPGGKSVTLAVSTQGELTPSRAMNAVSVVEQTFRGWVLSRGDLFKIFGKIESVYGALAQASNAARGAPSRSRGLFNRSLFEHTKNLQLYQIDTTVMFYPEALERAKGWLTTDYDESGLFAYLVGVNGERKTRLYCQMAEAQFGRNGPHVYRGRAIRGCAPDWIHSVMKLKLKGYPPDRRAQLDWYTELMGSFMEGAPIQNVMSRLDPKTYFFVTRVNGFRKNDGVGTVDYVSDTVGRFDNERGFGLYRDFASSYGVSPFELAARFFTEGL